MGNYNAYTKYVSVGIFGVLRMRMEFFSRIAIGLLLQVFLSLKETQYLHKVQIITSTLLVLIKVNYMNVVVIIFSLTVLYSNRPITSEIVDMY